MPRPFNGEKSLFNKWCGIGKLDVHMQKSQVGLLPKTICNNQLKELNVKAKIRKLLEEKIRC